MYCEHIDEKTKQIFGLTERQYDGYVYVEHIEQAYNGAWYLKGYAPEKPIEQCEAEVRSVRNQYLEQTDKYMITDYPITDDERELYKQYRTYLRDFTVAENWWNAPILTFDEWSAAR